MFCLHITCLLYTSGVLTLIVLVFGEITPKTCATINAEKIALANAKIIYTWMVIATPVSYTHLDVYKRQDQSTIFSYRKHLSLADLDTITQHLTLCKH